MLNYLSLFNKFRVFSTGKVNAGLSIWNLRQSYQFFQHFFPITSLLRIIVPWISWKSHWSTPFLLTYLMNPPEYLFELPSNSSLCRPQPDLVRITHKLNHIHLSTSTSLTFCLICPLSNFPILLRDSNKKCAEGRMQTDVITQKMPMLQLRRTKKMSMLETRLIVGN